MIVIYIKTGQAGAEQAFVGPDLVKTRTKDI